MSSSSGMDFKAVPCLSGEFDVGEGGVGVEGEAGDLDGAVGLGVEEVVFDGQVSVSDRFDEGFGLGAFSADEVLQSLGEAGVVLHQLFGATGSVGSLLTLLPIGLGISLVFADAFGLVDGD